MCQAISRLSFHLNTFNTFLDLWRSPKLKPEVFHIISVIHSLSIKLLKLDDVLDKIN
ncbi:MAG: hypothetical protein AAFQ80_03460 [Cyanobacteria bacterium J06621_8]